MTVPAHPDLLVVAWGWDHDVWQDSFYPDDLPGDWRLTYYANGYRGVVVPAEVTAATDPGGVQSWLQDTPPEFLFVLEYDPRLPAVCPLEPLVTTTGGRLAGVVLAAPAPVPPEVPVATLADGPPGVDPVWVDSGGDASTWCGRLAHLPAPGRPCRGVVERFLAASAGRGRAVLAFPPDPLAPDRMAEARVIAELLGA